MLTSLIYFTGHCSKYSYLDSSTKARYERVRVESLAVWLERVRVESLAVWLERVRVESLAVWPELVRVESLEYMA